MKRKGRKPFITFMVQVKSPLLEIEEDSLFAVDIDGKGIDVIKLVHY